MDGTLLSVSAAELYAHLGTASAPMLVDVRRQDAFDADDRMIIGAVLEGGISAWQEMKLPTRRKLRGRAESKWVTREHPKIDRIACPWLVSRFTNPRAEFIYAPPDQVTAVAEKAGGIPYDIKGAEFGHVGDRCSFDAIVRIFDIKDPALDHVATVVRGADTSRRDLAPECEGLSLISQ
jgi:hypothetical protein